MAIINPSRTGIVIVAPVSESISPRLFPSTFTRYSDFSEEFVRLDRANLGTGVLELPVTVSDTNKIAAKSIRINPDSENYDLNVTLQFFDKFGQSMPFLNKDGQISHIITAKDGRVNFSDLDIPRGTFWNRVSKAVIKYNAEVFTKTLLCCDDIIQQFLNGAPNCWRFQCPIPQPTPPPPPPPEPTLPTPEPSPEPIPVPSPEPQQPTAPQEPGQETGQEPGQEPRTQEEIPPEEDDDIPIHIIFAILAIILAVIIAIIVGVVVYGRSGDKNKKLKIDL